MIWNLLRFTSSPGHKLFSSFAFFSVDFRAKLRNCSQRRSLASDRQGCNYYYFFFFFALYVYAYLFVTVKSVWGAKPSAPPRTWSLKRHVMFIFPASLGSQSVSRQINSKRQQMARFVIPTWLLSCAASRPVHGGHESWYIHVLWQRFAFHITELILCQT